MAVGKIARALVAALLVGGLLLSALAPAATSLAPSPAGSEAWEPFFLQAPSAIAHRLYLPTIAHCDVTRFAVIGDYGGNSRAESDVAHLVKSWHPDLIITTGDNNYDHGAADTLDHSVGQFYSVYIHPYRGGYASDYASTRNRFFPSLGNHDWDTAHAQPYLDYFSLPGNERYYDFAWGAVHFFAIDSDVREPDGISLDSAQATWLRRRLAASMATWNIVYMHHPPFSSGRHGSSLKLRWLYREWGADAVLSGHDHLYERIMVDGFPHFVNGLGGKSIHGFSQVVPGSQVRYNADYGAMLVEANCSSITFQFYTRLGQLVDTYTLE